MARLKTIFTGHGSADDMADPVQRTYLLKFQNFCETQYTEIADKLRQAHKSNSYTREDDYLEVKTLFLAKTVGQGDWDTVCTTIQWLGSSDGQRFLRMLQNEKSK